ncbi:MAG: N-acetyl-gamma-glutamyl-phosphate reductase [Candidatus Faecousia sp.]|nr:N-acetyl-gamma-glutamyl-phosphate reductase [Clostridiales bacterium]MCI6937482.1 N-acetyl-gamma-glutamyl-phosphate reductase [Clostridiales bacterium]MDD5883431.1 N-acetyl-gamma-glutamyl-phosphate reductase [Bacillota bacterium]MDY4599893.1 N-acetyl-gamma-glutamyl-phosphate reductase [Candidatus Faecousia sp.]
MTKVFIDGSAGTTGLRIRERLSGRTDLKLLTLSEELRKDASARKDMLNSADIAFLCLPDAAAVEAVSLIENDHTAVIDTSTAHRVSEGWAYGFAELSPEHRRAIVTSKRVANPGCHASGFIAGVYPLVKHGVISPDFPLTAYSLTGYSGGGKKLIAEYEDENRDMRHESHRIYGTALTHKHLPEMQKICGLTRKPVFSPILGDFYAGMATTVLLPGIDAGTAWEALSDHYAGQNLISVAPLGGDEPVIYASTYAGKDTMRIQVSGQRDQCMVAAIFDNLGKGASGAAIQNMNLLLGLDETTGLSL